MPNIRRRPIKRRNDAGTLTNGQRCILLTGFDLYGQIGFETEAQMRRAWIANRELLMSDPQFAPLGSRPWGYWELEVGEHPRRGEDDTTALLRLNLPLHEAERALIEREQPRELPSQIFEGGREFWTEYCRAAEVRRDWHQRENRTDQANAYGAAAAQLRAMLAKG